LLIKRYIFKLGYGRNEIHNGIYNADCINNGKLKEELRMKQVERIKKVS